MARKATVPTPCSGGVPAEIAAPTTTTAKPAASTGIGAEPVGEPAADGPHDDRDDHEAGHPVRRVGRGEAVGGLEVRRQVDRERDVATEGDRVEDAGLPGDREPRRWPRCAVASDVGRHDPTRGVAQDQPGRDGVDGQHGGGDQERRLRAQVGRRASRWSAR